MNLPAKRCHTRRLMLGTPSLLRAGALLASAALALHELRYLLGSSATDAQVAGHSYLPLAGALTALALAVAFAHLLVLAGRARRAGRGAERGLGFGLAWLLSTTALVGTFASQELLEGALAGARADGLEAVLAGGGWVALPLAAVLGGLVALALAGARTVVSAAARRAPRPRAERASEGPSPALARSRRPSCPVLASHLAGRAPPLPS